MYRATKDDLWKELELLQPIIDKFDDFTFRIKNWFITIFVAISGFSLYLYAESKPAPELLGLNVFLVLIFYIYEVGYRTAHSAFLRRCREIEKFLREKLEISENDKGPYLGRYLFHPNKNTKGSRLLSFFLNIGIEKTLAERNEHQIKSILKESGTMLFQLRISLIYLFAFIVNMILALTMKYWVTFTISASIIVIIAVAIFMSYWFTKKKAKKPISADS